MALTLAWALLVVGCRPLESDPPREDPGAVAPAAQDDAQTKADAPDSWGYDDDGAPIEGLPVEYPKTRGALPDGDLGDLYAFPVERFGDVVTVLVTPDAGLDVQLELRCGGYEAAASEQGGPGASERVTYALDFGIGEGLPPEEEDYFQVLVTPTSGSGTYELAIDLTPQDEGAQGQDAPGEGSTPTNEAGEKQRAPGEQGERDSLLVGEGTYAGFLGSGDLTDRYRAHLDRKGQTLTVTVKPDKGLDVSISWRTPYETDPPWNDPKVATYYEYEYETADSGRRGGTESMRIVVDELMTLVFHHGDGRGPFDFEFDVGTDQDAVGRYSMTVRVE